MTRIRYSEFAHRIDVEAWEEAVGFEPKYLKRDGEEAIGFCLDPWSLHANGDTTGKLAINRDKRVINCFVCGGGTLLSYTMAIKDMDDVEATDWLYQFTRVLDESSEEFLDDIKRILFEAKAERKAWPYFNENVLSKFYELPVPVGFLFQRGISLEVIDRYRVGYDEMTRRASKGDFTGGAVVFPHWWGGRLVGWQTRWYGSPAPPKHIPKYVFTNDFPREDSIYGYTHVYLSPKPVIIVESVPTVLFLASHGYPAVATFGSSVTQEQLRWLRRLQQGVVVAPDNDKPGTKFERLLVDGLEPFIPVRVTERVPIEGGDLGDLVGHEEILHGLIKEAEYA